MKSFKSKYLESQPVPHRLILSIGAIREAKGRAALYRQQQPQALETLRQAAVIQSTESSNRIEGITAPIQRIKALVEEKTTPQNRSEQEIAGYRDVLNLIHGNFEHIPCTPNFILQLHRDLFKYLPDDGRHWKMADNSISEKHPDGTETIRFQPVAAHRTATAMAELCEGFNAVWRAQEIDPLFLIPAFVLDFLCIHPFRDGNGRMARLLSLLLLYQAGYDVGRYISLEKLTETSKESYYDTLKQSSEGWHKGQHPLLPWTEYFLGLIVAAYGELETRSGQLITARGAKSDTILKAMDSFFGEFSIRDVQEACPHVSIDLIRRVMKDEKAKGHLESLGRGPQSKWKTTKSVKKRQNPS